MLLCLVLFLAQAAAPHAERGYALAQRGELKGAEAELRQAVELAPHDAGMRYNLAVVQFRLGEQEAALANLERVLRQAPGHAQAASLKAEITYRATLNLYAAGRFAESQAALERLIAAGKPEARVLRLLAWCHHRQNRPNEAVAMIRRAIEAAPADATEYSHAAQILLENRQVRAAYAAAGKALQLKPDSVHTLKIKGRVEIERGDFKQALKSFQRAVELDPSDPEGLQWLGTAQQMLLQYAEAAATFEKGVTSFPGFAPMYEAHARLLLDPGTPPGAPSEQRAAALLEKALELDNALPQAHYELGKLLLGEGKAVEGLRHLEAAARLDPRSSRTHLALAGAYRAVGRTADQAKALERYRQAKSLEAEQW
jgi:tetratricopeptide (TPR) repeat protein